MATSTKQSEEEDDPVKPKLEPFSSNVHHVVVKAELVANPCILSQALNFPTSRNLSAMTEHIPPSQQFDSVIRYLTNSVCQKCSHSTTSKWSRSSNSHNRSSHSGHYPYSSCATCHFHRPRCLSVLRSLQVQKIGKSLRNGQWRALSLLTSIVLISDLKSLYCVKLFYVDSQLSMQG